MLFFFGMFMHCMMNKRYLCMSSCTHVQVAMHMSYVEAKS